MEMTKGKGSRRLAGQKRNPSRDTIKMLKPIISHSRRRRHRIRLTEDFWNHVKFWGACIGTPLLYMLLQRIGGAIL